MGSERLIRAGLWSVSDGCVSSQRGDAQTRYYAKRFTFTLGVDAEVTIALSSSVDTYLYLLWGHGAAGDLRAYNDDADSTTRDSRLKLDLVAGKYTIEATAVVPRQEGSFTLTVGADVAAAVPVTVTRLAGSYDAAVGELFSAGFNYGPGAAEVSVKSVEPSGLTLTLADGSGSAGFAGTPKLAGSYTVVLEFVQPGLTENEEFTVDASCAAGHFQQADRSCEPCTAPLGGVGSGRLGLSAGSWDEGCVLPAGRMGRSGAFYARHYTFTLSDAAEVTIDLESRTQDTYLFLLRGHGPDATPVARDDDGGRSYNSRLANLELKAGGYTISASTYHRRRTGDFSVAALGVLGLRESYRATVGEVFSAGFKYRPRAAALKIASVTPEGLSLKPADLNGDVGIAGTPTKVGTYTATLELTQGTQTHTSTLIIAATCPTGKAPHIDGSRACTPTATVPAGCSVTSLDRVGRSWWGHVSAEADYSVYGSGAPAACHALSGLRRAVYYSFTVPAFAASDNPPSNQQARVRIKPRPKRSSRPPFSSPGTPLVDGGKPTVGLWKLAQGSQASLVKRQTTAAGRDPSLDAVLPAGRYLVEITPTTTSTKQGGFTLDVWLPVPEKVHTDVKKLGNTGLNGAGMTLEGFLEARGSICYGAHTTCPTDADNPFDPPSPTYPWLPFSTDKCSIPEALAKGIEAWINQQILEYSSPFTTPQLVDLAQYMEDHAKFGEKENETVSLVFACMRHDFNWRNLYRVEHHLQHGDAWNKNVRQQADNRFNEDLKRLCEANRTSSSATHSNYTWKLVDVKLRDKCLEVADAMKFGVQTYPMFLINYGSNKV